MSALDRLVVRSRELELPIVLDSSALIGYLAGEEPIAGLIAPLVESNELEIIVSAIALSEALVRTARMFDWKRVQIVVESIDDLPAISVVTFDREQAIEAALVRARTGLKLPDAAIVAAARLLGGLAIVGNDRAWKNKSLGVQYIHLDDVMRELEGESG